MSHRLLPFAPVAALLLLAACGSGADEHHAPATPAEKAAAKALADSAAMPTDSLRIAKKGGVVVDGVAMTGDRTIVANAARAKSVSTLVGLVQQAGLAETLQGGGPYTVFAPTNAAFAKLPAAALATLQAPANAAKLKGVLTYHVIQSRLLAADFQNGQTLTTLSGEKLHFTRQGNKLLVSNGRDAPATVQVADIISKNGVTHLIDGVLLPLE